MSAKKSSSETWVSIIDNTLEVIVTDDSFDEGSPMDKILSFYYYHVDSMVDHRMFLKKALDLPFNPIT